MPNKKHHFFNHSYDWLRYCQYTDWYIIASGVDRFKRQFVHLEEIGAKGEKTSPQLRQHASLPRQYLFFTEEKHYSLLSWRCFFFMSLEWNRIIHWFKFCCMKQSSVSLPYEVDHAKLIWVSIIILQRMSNINNTKGVASFLLGLYNNNSLPACLWSLLN